MSLFIGRNVSFGRLKQKRDQPSHIFILASGSLPDDPSYEPLCGFIESSRGPFTRGYDSPSCKVCQRLQYTKSGAARIEAAKRKEPVTCEA